ncbi:MAG: single-stranded-DNA-specific exonuclease RecJ [Alphaproteobacteria bacterium]|nr:single-stranded-DNA-specific exonuclease RecJ [Alphaproteobacteria bacterium]
MEKSFSGKIWNFLECDEDKLREFKDVGLIGDLTARILLNRGFHEASEIVSFLGAKLRNTIPDPSLLLGMDEGVDRIAAAILKNEKIVVFGDYDVDGITATYLIVKYLRLLGLQPHRHIPDRFAEGYGISKNSLEEAAHCGASLAIAVDCGTNSFDEISAAKKQGLDFVVLDHHVQSIDPLPPAVAIINPNRNDQAEIGIAHIKKLCAAGVAFLFLIALQRKLKEVGFFRCKSIPDLREFTDAVALGTLCDVMELRGINRAVVKHSLSKGQCPTGIAALMQAFGIEKLSSPEDLSFFVGPALNAAGRIGDPSVALNLLLEENTERASKIARHLLELNAKRKSIEKEILANALVMIKEQDLTGHRGICVADMGWHEGVIGIVAGKLKDKFNKPIFAISIGEGGICKGSARSIDGFHIGEFFKKACNAGIILRGGGHALAGGFTIEIGKLTEFQSLIDSEIRCEFQSVLSIDCTLSPLSNLSQIAKELAYIEPFGKGVEKPVFCFKRLLLRDARKTGTGNHLMLKFSDEFGKGSLRVMLFKSDTKPEICRELDNNKNELLDIAGTIRYHEQFGGSVILEDARVSMQ